MNSMMENLFGNNVLKIEAPQDRSRLTFVVATEENRFDSANIRFFNMDNSPIKINFSDLSIFMVLDPDTETTTLGEFEYVKSIEGGFEIFGDFGIIWVYCDACSPKL